MEEHEVTERGIDVQRFVTFGIIKGFIRRVHRWPVLLPRDRTLITEKLSTTTSDQGGALNGTQAGISAALKSSTSPRVPTNWVGTRTRSESTSRSKGTAPSNAPLQPIQPSNAPLAAQLVASRAPLARSSSHRVDINDQILEQLPALLDGSRHTDELCTIFRLSWKELERKLIEVGEGEYDYAAEEKLAQEAGRADRLGRVRIIYR